MHTTSVRTLIALAAALVGCGASPTDIEELKKGQRDILAKLEGLDKAVQQVRAAPAARPGAPDPNKVYTIPIGASAIRGPKDAKVTVVEFADFQCPFCAQATPLVEQVLEAYPKQVNYVFKQFPLTQIHPNAMPASKAALAAGKQGKYWEMHDLLFKNYRELGPEKLKEYAAQAGLDVARWEKDMASPEIQQQVDRDMADGRSADVQGTPSFFVAGKRVQTRTLDGFKQLIDAAM